MKKVNVSELVIGNVYSVDLKGSYLPTATLTYVGIHSHRGKSPEYWFTYGIADNWKNQCNLVATKSRLIIKEI